MATPGPERQGGVGQCSAWADGSLLPDGADGSKLLLPGRVEALRRAGLDVQTGRKGKRGVVWNVFGAVEEADGEVRGC